jgi:hypothetical protein
MSPRPFDTTRVRGEMPQHQHLLVPGPGPRRDHRLEGGLQPSPPAQLARLATTSRLRCWLHPPMIDSHSQWISSRGPAMATENEHVLWVTAGSVVQGEHTDGGTWRGASQPPRTAPPRHVSLTESERRAQIRRSQVRTTIQRQLPTCLRRAIIGSAAGSARP